MIELIEETARTKSIVLDVAEWQGHRAGQHVDVRLTAEDGYQAHRSYSIASAREDDYLALTVERLEDDEVLPYLIAELRSGDDLELRCPVGGYFVWESSLGGPLLLIGGSGVVPFRSMLRHHRATESTVPVRRLYSARSLPGEVGWQVDERPPAYACGPTGFVETAASVLVALGHEPGRIRT